MIQFSVTEKEAELMARAMRLYGKHHSSGPSEAHDCQVIVKMLVDKMDTEGEARSG